MLGGDPLVGREIEVATGAPDGDDRSLPVADASRRSSAQKLRDAEDGALGPGGAEEPRGRNVG